MFVSGRRSSSNNINNSRSTSADQSTGLHEQQQKLHQNLLQFNEQQKRYNLISDVSNQEVDRVPAASHSAAPANQQNTENNEKDQQLHYKDLLAPPPSFQDERLALLRHLKETPRLVTASTQLMESSLNLGNGNNNNNTLRSSPLRANSEPGKQQHPSPLRMFRPVLVSPSNINNAIDHNNSNNQTRKIMLESSKSPSPRPQQNNRTVVRSSLDGIGVGDDVPLYELPSARNNSSSTVIKLELLESQERQEWILIALHEELPEIWRKFMREHAKIIQKESSRRAENSSRQLLLDALGGGRGFGAVSNAPRDISIEALVRAIENAHFVRLQETSQIMDCMSSDLKNCRAREVDLLEQLEELKEYHIDTVNLMTRKFEFEKELVLKKSEETLIDRVRRMAKRVKSQDQEIMSVLREVADENNNNANENINSTRRVRESVALSQSPSRSASQQQQQQQQVHHHHYYDANSRSGSALNNQNNSDQQNNNNNTNQNQLQFALKVLDTLFSNSQSSVNPPSRSTSTLMAITGTNTKDNQDDQIVTNDAKQLKHSDVVNSTTMPPLAPSSLMHPASTSSNTVSPVVVKISRLQSQIPERVPSSKVIISPVISPKNSSPPAPLATHQNQDDVIGGEEFATAESSSDSHDDVAGLNKTNPPELQQQIQQAHQQQHAPRISVSLIQPIQPVSSGYRKNHHQHQDNNNDDDGNDDVILARPSISSDNQKSGSRSSGRFVVVPAISSRSGSVNHNEAAAVIVEAPPKRFQERNENNEKNGRFRVRKPTSGNNDVPQQQGSYPEFHQLIKQGISPYFHDE